MLAYVLFGGMIATTWVQIVKAVLLLGGAPLLALLVLARFAFNPLALFAEAARQYGDGVLSPGRLVTDPVDAISLGLALMLGTAGLPHILMRFYTVPDAQDGAHVGRLRHRVHRLLLSADVHPRLRRHGDHRPRGDHGRRRRRQHGGAAAGRGRRRHAVPRVHLRRRVRDHPGRRGRPDAVGRGHAVARPVGERRARRASPTRAKSSWWRAWPRWCWPSSRSCSASRSRGRTSPTWWAWRSRSPPAPTSRRWCCRSSGAG